MMKFTAQKRRPCHPECLHVILSASEGSAHHPCHPQPHHVILRCAQDDIPAEMTWEAADPSLPLRMTCPGLVVTLHHRAATLNDIVHLLREVAG